VIGAEEGSVTCALLLFPDATPTDSASVLLLLLPPCFCLGAAWWELVLEVLFFFEEASFESIFVIMCFKVNKKVSEWFDRRADEVL